VPTKQTCSPPRLTRSGYDHHFCSGEGGLPSPHFTFGGAAVEVYWSGPLDCGARVPYKP
jgi:hypothetical protein